jgi:hypothetical protein
VLNGSLISSSDGTATYWWRYGTTDAYGSETSRGALSTTADTPYPVGRALSGLAPATTYHFQMCARDETESEPRDLCSKDRIFTTPSTACDTANLTLESASGAQIASAAIIDTTAGTRCRLLRVVPDSTQPATSRADEIAPNGLFGFGRTAIPPAPTGYARTNPVVWFSAENHVGERMCLVSPPDAANYDQVRMAYYDTRPEVDRWVFLESALSGQQICMTRTLRSPLTAAFSLFGQL